MIGVFERTTAVLFALRGRVYRSPAGVRMKVKNIRSVRIQIAISIVIGLLISSILLNIGHVTLAAAATAIMVIMVFHAFYFAPHIESVSQVERDDDELTI
jgi:cytochrome bd-type quinol oxidase subunit 1